jgi:hypothetical protein
VALMCLIEVALRWNHFLANRISVKHAVTVRSPTVVSGLSKIKLYLTRSAVRTNRNTRICDPKWKSLVDYLACLVCLTARLSKRATLAFP